jgi:hypothetical protein
MSSVGGVANGEFGTCTPATSLTMAFFDSVAAALWRSSASDSARRTRGSLNGAFSWLTAMTSPQFQGLVCTVALLPSARTMSSRCAGENPRNWMWARPELMAAAWAASSRMNSA